MGLRYIIVLGITLVISSCSRTNMPESGDKEVRRAIALYKRDEVIDAVLLFEAAAGKPLRIYDLWEVHAYIGSCYLDLDKYERSLAASSRALEEDPKHHQVWVNKGIVLRKLDRLDEAEECYRKALELKPDYAELHSSLGSLHIVRGNPREALQCFKRAITLSPSLAGAHGNYALALGMIGDLSSAEEELKSAARLGYPNVATIRKQIKMMKLNLDEENGQE